MSPLSSMNGFLVSSNVANREYRIVCSCQFVYFLRQCILNYDSLVISTGAIFLNSRWRPDIMSVVISTKFNMKLYITKYIWVQHFVLLSSIYSEICLIINIQDDHFKVQYGDQVSCQYQFHMDSCNVKCMCANFGSPVVNIF